MKYLITTLLVVSVVAERDKWVWKKSSSEKTGRSKSTLLEDESRPVIFPGEAERQIVSESAQKNDFDIPIRQLPIQYPGSDGRNEKLTNFVRKGLSGRGTSTDIEADGSKTFRFLNRKRESKKSKTRSDPPPFHKTDSSESSSKQSKRQIGLRRRVLNSPGSRNGRNDNPIRNSALVVPADISALPLENEFNSPPGQPFNSPTPLHQKLSPHVSSPDRKVNKTPEEPPVKREISKQRSNTQIRRRPTTPTRDSSKNAKPNLRLSRLRTRKSRDKINQNTNLESKNPKTSIQTPPQPSDIIREQRKESVNIRDQKAITSGFPKTISSDGFQSIEQRNQKSVVTPSFVVPLSNPVQPPVISKGPSSNEHYIGTHPESFNPLPQPVNLKFKQKPAQLENIVKPTGHVLQQNGVQIQKLGGPTPLIQKPIIINQQLEVPAESYVSDKKIISNPALIVPATQTFASPILQQNGGQFENLVSKTPVIQNHNLLNQQVPDQSYASYSKSSVLNPPIRQQNSFKVHPVATGEHFFPKVHVGIKTNNQKSIIDQSLLTNSYLPPSNSYLPPANSYLPPKPSLPESPAEIHKAKLVSSVLNQKNAHSLVLTNQIYPSPKDHLLHQSNPAYLEFQPLIKNGNNKLEETYIDIYEKDKDISSESQEDSLGFLLSSAGRTGYPPAQWSWTEEE